MAKMDSDIVGWITRGGKRIPIRKGKGPGNNQKPMKRTDGSEHDAYNNKVLEKHAKDIERHGSVSVSFDSYSGTNKDFIAAAEKAGYYARYDRDSDAVIVSKSKKDDTLKNAKYKKRNGNKIYY